MKHRTAKPRPKAPAAARRTALRADPTRTAGLRRRFCAEIRRRFALLRRAVAELVAGEDAFGLAPRRGWQPPKVRQGLHVVNARQWEFRSDADKVEEFQAWLRGKYGETVSGRGQEQLWERYVAEGYRNGARAAFDKARPVGKRQGKEQNLDFFAGTRQEFLRGSFANPKAVERVQLLAGRAWDDLENVTADMSARMSRVLADALVRGNQPAHVARRLVDEVGLGEDRAMLIARTEVVRAHNEAILDTLEDLGHTEVGVNVEWEVLEDEKLCVRCEAMREVVLPIEDARGMLPLHPNCLPGDSLVLSRSGVAAASERWFDGDMVVLRTASGRELTCTPNHPVLAEGGLWTPARLLHPGDHVVCDGGREWRDVGNGHHEHVPTSIHQVAEALRRSGKVVAAEVPVSAPDFHGDGGGSEVAVVWTDRELRHRGQAPLRQHPAEPDLRRGDVDRRRGLLPSLRAAAEFLERRLAAAASLMGSCRLRGPLLAGHLGPLEGLGFALVAGGHAGLEEAVAHGRAGRAEALGHGVLALPRKVRRDDLGRRQALGLELASGGSCPVYLDRLVSVRTASYSGHVYNLETGDGWYGANGIITHNCRCAWQLAPADEEPTPKGEVEELLSD